MKAIEIQSKILESLKKFLKDIPFVQIDNISIGQRIGRFVRDAVCNVRVDDESIKLVLEIKSPGEPRQVRSAIQQLKESEEQSNKTYNIIGAPYISEDSARICKENGIGYIDLAENCFLSFCKVYVERKNYPNRNIEKRSIRSIFATKASRILRVMLCNPKKYWQVQELSNEADVSIGQAFKVKEKLLDLEFVREENRRIILNIPEQLLVKWASNYSFRKNKIYDYFAFGESKEIEKRIAGYCTKNKITYAFTLFSGAALIAPYTRYTRVFVYVKDKIWELASSLDLKKVDSGPNVTLLYPYDEGVFYDTQQIDGITIVCNIQLYLDLISYKGRGEESAEFLLKEKIKPQW